MIESAGVQRRALRVLHDGRGKVRAVRGSIGARTRVHSALVLSASEQGGCGNRPRPALSATVQSKMGDQHASKPKPKPPSRLGKGPTPSSWKPGQSGNPKGRPRAGLAFAERVRERVDPDLVIELAMRVAEDEKLTPSERLLALWPLIDRGYVKPPAGLDMHISGQPAAEYDVDKLSTDEKRELLAKIDALQVSGEDTTLRLTEPQGTDDSNA